MSKLIVGMMNKVLFKLALVLGLAVGLAFPLQIQATTIGNALTDRQYATDNATNVFVMDFAVGQAATLQSISTWSQAETDSLGNVSAGFSFTAYVLQFLSGTSYKVAFSTGPHTVVGADVVNTFSVSPFALQASDWIAHFGQGIPLTDSRRITF